MVKKSVSVLCFYQDLIFLQTLHKKSKGTRRYILLKLKNHNQLKLFSVFKRKVNELASFIKSYKLKQTFKVGKYCSRVSLIH